MLPIRDPLQDIPDIAVDARRRRITTLVNAAYLGRSTPALYVIEDAHWIDPISESMLADFLSVVARTQSLVLVTSRPEYRGALSDVPGAQTIFLSPLEDSETTSLITELLGPHPSVAGLISQIAERAAGIIERLNADYTGLVPSLPYNKERDKTTLLLNPDSIRTFSLQLANVVSSIPQYC